MKRWLRAMAIVLILGGVLIQNGFSKPGIFGSQQQKEKPVSTKTILAVRISNHSIKIDGKLTDPVWQRAPKADDFIQQQPDEGKPATQKTTLQVAYDNQNLYIGIRAFDTRPDSIFAQLTRRDQLSQGDWLGVAIDSYFDHRTAFVFGVNAVGVQMDMLVSNDGSTEDTNWNAVWRVSISRDSLGWSAEFQIPFSQLRFSGGPSTVWGFQAFRMIYRNNEQDYWAPQPRDAGGYVSRFGELRGLRDLKSPKNLELFPYGMASETVSPKIEGDPFRTGYSHTLNSGLDLKYGLTSNITLNATINPDFGQVEADPSELNLSAYETFFEEKRPFFVEGSNIFNAPLGIGDGDMASEGLFYSRRIGRAPHYYPDVPDSAYVKMPEQTHIIGASKITGKTARGWSVGILDAVTNQEKATIQEGSRRYMEIVEPYTNYAVFRLKKDFRKGRTTLGLIGTNVFRNIPNAHFNFLNKQATTGGVDVNHRWGKDAYALQFSLYGSTILGDKEAIQRAQKSSARYYQRPDIKYVHYDPNRTSLSGLSSSFFIGKIAQGHWRGGAGYMTRTPGFEANDIGYMREANYFSSFLWGGYREFKPGKIFRDYNLNTNMWTSWYFGGEHVGNGFNLNANFRLLNYWGGFFGINRQTQQLRTSTLRGGPAMLAPGQINSFFGFYSDSRKPISLSLHGRVSRNDQNFWSGGVSPSIHARPLANFNFSLSINYSINNNDMQYVSTLRDENNRDHYILGHLDQKILSFTMRINYTLTPNLSLQFYGQPFITAGRYSNFREVIRPRARRYADRFAPYDYSGSPDFNFKQFRSNLVLRWEYHPGSTLFVVWSQGRTDYTDIGEFHPNTDFERLFKAQGNHVFLIKLNHWFSL
ncbi:MAG: carbohydrate binding family 9 domain-containing protein [Calditrichaeota bacterium]|nr:carbohydrate binding family 9 domain-containing protein [Calditrichota bacterium]